MAGEVVLFDLDGTLTDPGVGIFASVRHAVERLGLPPLSDAQLRGFIGPPLPESFASLGLTPTGVTRAIAAYREYFADRGLYENVVYEGIPDLLDGLRADGFTLGVATSKPEVFAERIVEHFDLDQHFAVVVGSELDGSRRHKDEVIAQCLAELPGGEVLAMVGDRLHDVRGAAAHGVPCIGVTWGYATDGELADAGAAALVHTPAEIPAALAGLVAVP